MTVRVGVVGVGNCASALVQGVEYYKQTRERAGLMSPRVGEIGPENIHFSAAFDVNSEKIYQDLSRAIGLGPNNAESFCEVPELGVAVQPGATLDGVGSVYGGKVAAIKNEGHQVKRHLLETETDVLVNYLPVGSTEATEFYANAALDAGVAFVNAIPVPLAAQAKWAEKYRSRGVPLIGDDIKSQVGATIVHRVLAQLFSDRGVSLDKTYQLNVGGNMDFYNMLESSRLKDKRDSKARAVTDVANEGEGMEARNVHIGPSDYVEWLEDKKVAFIRMEGTAFGGAPLNLELRLEVHDSPNSAGVVIDAVRYAKLAQERGEGGILPDVCSWLMKSPPHNVEDGQALRRVVEWAAG